MDFRMKNDEAIQLSNTKKNQKGVTTVEYAVMLVLVALAVVIFGKGIGNSITGVFSQLVSAIG